jgi:hypothetical protein
MAEGMAQMAGQLTSVKPQAQTPTPVVPKKKKNKKIQKWLQLCRQECSFLNY